MTSRLRGKLLGGPLRLQVLLRLRANRLISQFGTRRLIPDYVITLSANYPCGTFRQPASAAVPSSTTTVSSGVSTFPTSSSSQRDVDIVNLVSSDDESSGHDAPIRRKRQRLTPISRIPSSSTSQESAARRTRGKLVATFQYVEVPIRQSGTAQAIEPKSPESKARRERFLQNLSALSGPPVRVINSIDETSPSTAFRFIDSSILGPGVEAVSEEVMVGCNCRKDNGRQIGCEYLSCDCIEDSQENEDGKKVFPYAAGRFDFGCLRLFYLNSRNHIFECNKNCNCDLDCKNRLVQHGRKVALEIFKTQDRGWGMFLIFIVPIIMY